MGIFNRLGRKAEKLKRQAEAASAEEATHRCPDCEQLLYTDHEECPECGGTDVYEIDEATSME